MISTICFDFYDVIHVDPLNKWLNDHGLERTGVIAETVRQYDRGLIDINGMLNELSKISGQNPEYIREQFVASPRFDDDIVELIKKLSPHYTLILISNAGGPNLRDLITTRGIDSYFNDIIISGEVGVIKPERKIFELALKRNNIEVHQALFIDDNPHNTQAAHNYGWDTITYESYPQLLEELQQRSII